MSEDRKPRLLIVDDEAGIRGVLREFLSEYDYEVLEAEDGKAALAILAEEEVDVAIVDIFMPGVDGFEVLAEIRSRSVPIQVIAMSGGGGAWSAGPPLRLAELLGAAVTLEKPFDLHRLLVEVEHCLKAA